MNTAQASAFYDIQGLASLRAQASTAPGQATREVGAQFEALFMQMMVKSMREATISGGLFDSNQMDFYQGMFDQQVSLHLSRQGALGLSDILVEQLDGNPAATGRTQQAGEELRPELLLARRGNASPAAAMPLMPGASTAAPAAASAAATGQSGWLPQSPEEFIRGVWRYAADAAARIGLDPDVLVAQSALETGWGRKVMKAADGSSSFNLFGIKADARWDGASTSVNTLEYRDGIAQVQRASFRVYESIRESFDDYVDFLTSNPRYQDALGKVRDGREFLRELQGAGYATDPAYADKIINIIDTEAYGPVFEALKSTASLSLTGQNG